MKLCVQKDFSIICGLSMTISLFTSQIPKTAEKLVILNNPVCVTAIISVMVLITWFSPVLAGKAGKYWVRSADLHTFSNRLFAYYGRLGYDSKRQRYMRIYQQEKICEKHNLSKEILSVPRDYLPDMERDLLDFTWQRLPQYL